jgi:DNA polymerase-1
MVKDKKKLFLLDAFALIYRAYFAFAKNPRINSKGLDTSAVFGFTNSLLEILRKEKPSHIAVVFDTKKPTERHIEFPAYKAHRDAMPEGISAALPYIDKLLEALSIPKIYKDGFEADDVVGTIAKKAEKEDFTVYMMTSDKDFAQLVSENIFMYRPGNKWQPTETWGIKEVLDKFKINRVEQVIDFLAMMGDSADNIPGISGVGKKTAQKFIQEYDSVEGLFANTDKLKGKLKEKVEGSKEIGMLSKKLVTIITNVPVEFDFEKMKFDVNNFDELSVLFEELEFRNFISRFNDLLNNQDVIKTIKPEENDPLPDNQIDLFSEVPTNNQVKKIIKEKINFKDISSPSDLEEYILKNSTQASFTFNLLIENQEIIGLGLLFGNQDCVFVRLNDKDKVKYFQIIKLLFENELFLKIGYDLKSQIKIFNKSDILLKGQIFDVVIAHYILHPDMRHNLDVMASSYLNINIDNDKELLSRSPNKTYFSHLSNERISEVSSQRVFVLDKLQILFSKELEEIKSKELFANIEMPLIKVLAKMESSGVGLDVKMLKEYSIELEEKLQSATRDIYILAGLEFNISSPKQLGEILFEKMNLVKKPKKTKSGQYSTSEETLQNIKESSPIISYILEFREIKKLLSTYVNALPLLVDESSGRIHTTFNQSVAATGRLSSKNPNIQNIPIRTKRGMKVREAFIPKSGCLLLAADYSQIELRIMASLSNDKSMLEAFNNGVDIHAATAAKVFKVDITNVSREMRSKAKSVNFGIIYGISAFGLSQNTGMSRSEAKDIIDQYFEEFPGVKKYMEESVLIARENEFVETILGRRRYLKDINSRNAIMRNAAERNAINAPIQGSAADIIKKAMIDIDNKISIKGLKSSMLLQVHDELIFDMITGEEQELTEIINTSMMNASSLSVPLVVDMGSGNNWLEAH